MPVYTVLSPLLHDGKGYAVSDKLEAEESIALPLVLAGVLKQELRKAEQRPAKHAARKGKHNDICRF